MKLIEKHENNLDGRHPLPALLHIKATLMTAKMWASPRRIVLFV